MKIVPIISLVICIIMASCINNSTPSKNPNSLKMELKVLSNYGSDEKLVTDSATAEQISQTMNGLDWNEFHQVILTKANGDWLELSGNLKSDGLSAMYEENRKQYIIDKPPLDIDHMTRIILSYYSGDEKFKEENKFE